MQAFKDAIIAYGWFYPVVEFLGMLALAMLLAYGGFQIRAGELTLGVLVAFFQYGMRFFRPIQDLSEKYNILQSAMAASERIFALLDTEVRDRGARGGEAVPRGQRGRIEFDDVWFAYKDEDWVLRDVSFAIEPGETVAVVGHTGAGKTTLISLLLRFYDVQRGAIRDRRRRHPRVRSARTCGAISASCCRIRICSPAPSRATSGWARSGSPTRRWRRPPSR